MIDECQNDFIDINLGDKVKNIFLLYDICTNEIDTIILEEEKYYELYFDEGFLFLHSLDLNLEEFLKDMDKKIIDTYENRKLELVKIKYYNNKLSFYSSWINVKFEIIGDNIMAFNLDKKYIDEVEKTLETTLPSAYKKSMMQSNGGTIELDDEVWELFPIQDNSDKKRLSRSCNHILHETKLAKEWNGFPKDSLAIASNAMGDLLILKKDDNKYLDIIYKWSHETKVSEIVADSFDNLEVE